MYNRQNCMLLPDSAQGRWFKANLHCHTTLSDGHLTHEQIKAVYKTKGYACVAFTDHNTYRHHASLDDAEFLALAANEVDISETQSNQRGPHSTKTYHFNLFDTAPWTDAEKKLDALRPQEKYEDITSLNNYIARMSAMGMLVCYNHPYWSLQDTTDYKDLKGLWGMEIYNHGCEIDGLYGYNPQSYDEMLRAGQRLHCVATDDNHNSFPFDSPYNDSFGGWCMIHAPKLDYGSIMDAMIAGRFYNTMGPEIHSLWIEDGRLHILTSPVTKMAVHNQGRAFKVAIAPRGQTLSEAVFALEGNERYIHVEVKDERGLFANTNAYFFE